jgi:hypothetical protein
MMKQEIWKNVELEGIEGYKVSNYGRVISFKINEKGVLLKAHIVGDGYERVNLRKNGRKKQLYVHRLVAIHFIPNPDNKPEVNHINAKRDKNGKLLNHAYNLEWATRKEQEQHSSKHGLKRKTNGKRPVWQKDVNGSVIAKFSSLSEAARAINGNPSRIKDVCKKIKLKTYKGYIWEYVSSE